MMWEIQFDGTMVMESDEEPTQTEIEEFLNSEGVHFNDAILGPRLA